ncbi:MAG: hypothetical protein CSA75_02550 [Sorangium cellulosum]|nr:MAG: hypothetical protein CSA75_02550 [Sorangium cellulosum]
MQFPTDARAPESRKHYELRTALFQIAKLALSSVASIGSDQLVYWNASDPSRCVAPDLLIRLGGPDTFFESWKTWERGSPEIAVEILSESNATEMSWADQLQRYHECGVQEVVRFDPVAPAECLRVWDRIRGDLVERALNDPLVAESAVLGLCWIVVKDLALGRLLRLAKDASGGRLLPTPVEREAMKRFEAERRVHELEEQLRNQKDSTPIKRFEY